MWNDTDIPLAYLITFRCYGTWLHGDKRGSIDRFLQRVQNLHTSSRIRDGIVTMLKRLKESR
jgi:hypothetical protein